MITLRRLWSGLWSPRADVVSRAAIARAVAEQRVRDQEWDEPVATEALQRQIRDGGRFYRPARFGR